MSIIRVPYQPHRYKGALDSLVAHYFLDKYFSSGQTILDPMAGSKTVEKEANKLGLCCNSNDLSYPEGWDARGRWPFKDTQFHGVILHPPYFKAKKYSDDERDLGNIKDINLYIAEMLNIMAEAKRVTIPNGYIILIIGDYRKSKKLTLIGSRIYVQMEDTLGLSLENYDLWEISATGTSFISSKHFIMLNWIYAYRRPEMTLEEFSDERGKAR